MLFKGPATGVAATGAVEESEAAQTITLAQAVEDTNATGKTGAAIDGITAGLNLLADNAKALINSYGLTPTQVRLLRDFCEKNGITVALRSRSARAAELIQKGIAVGKNLVIKIKNVDNIDVAFLGYSRADLNTVVWAPDLQGRTARKHRSIPRRHTRTARPRRSTLRATRQGMGQPRVPREDREVDLTKQIELRFDGAGSSAAALDEDRTVYRRFELEQVKTMNRPYGRLMVGVKPGDAARLARVTQDVDTVAVLGGNGQILSPAARVKAYEYLENILGIQHPDTVPWILNGEIAFEAKIKLLVDHLAGGEPLAVFGANGSVNAGYFNPTMTVFNKTTNGGYIYFDGAYNNPYAPEAIGALAKQLGPDG